MPQTKEKSKSTALVTGDAVRLGKMFVLNLAEDDYDGNA